MITTLKSEGPWQGLTRIPRRESLETADWFERETYDMFGIEYVGHHIGEGFFYQMIGKAGHYVRIIRSKKPITVL